MASLYLPAPVRSKAQELQKVSTSTQLTTSNSPKTNVAQQPPTTQRRAPSYEERCRSAAEFSKLTTEQRKRAPKLFVPRSISDFDDGGAVSLKHVLFFLKLRYFNRIYSF